MNVRDPFNLHRSPAFNILRGTATRAAANVTQKVVEAGAQALESGRQAVEDMSTFSIPKNVPSFTNPQRELENRVWGASGVTARSAASHSNGGVMSGVQDRVGGFFDKNKGDLPMYKDKPYAPSRRNRSVWRRKRTLGIFGTFVIAALYFLGPEKAGSKIDWLDRRERVKEAFILSWDAYDRYAWGYDEFHPISKKGRQMTPKGMGWIIVDALDTMMLMNLTSRLSHAREWLSTKLDYEQDQEVNTFETTIRMLGGLLSAHYLSTEFPDMAPLTDDDEGAAGEDLYLEKAKDLADRIMGAFESPSGIPYASVNLKTSQGVVSHADGGASSTAEAATLQLELKYLTKLTGETFYWEKAEKVIKIIDDNGMEDGLLPIYIYAHDGHFRGSNIRLGSRGDSYYEYLIKQYLQTSKEEPIYEELWDEALAGVQKHLITYSSPSQFTVLAERPDGLHNAISPKMDHLVCFMPGTIALGATGGISEKEARKLPTWNSKNDKEMQLARELTKTCWGMYKVMATGLAPEIAHFNIHDPPLPASAPHKSPDTFDDLGDAEWKKDFVLKPADVHNLQRPETIESLFYMWRITGDDIYREWGWDMFKSFLNYTAVEEGGGFTSLGNANIIPPQKRDNMESFWLAETLKYFYLLFSPNDLIPLDKVVINTEAHIFPRFKLGPLFKTGWKRKPRGPDGKILPDPPVKVEPSADRTLKGRLHTVWKAIMNDVEKGSQKGSLYSKDAVPSPVYSNHVGEPNYEETTEIHQSLGRRIIESFKRDPTLNVTPRGAIGSNGRVFNPENAALATANSPLARRLKGRHLQMIAIGGSIGTLSLGNLVWQLLMFQGTGLFVASGKALEAGGPASLLICFSLIGIMLYCTVHALGEMAVLFPVAGSFSAYSTRFLDPAWGFAMGWNYAMQWLVVLPLEIIAASITIDFWDRNGKYDHAIFVTVFLITIITINLFGVKGYGEAEFFFAIIKVIAVIGYILLAIVLNCGGGLDGSYIGGRYWIDPGAFHNGFKGLCSVFVTAAFAFAGTELVGLAAAETANPRKSLPTAVKQVFWRISLFYIVSLTLVGLLVPYNDYRLLTGGTANAAASPFVISIQNAGIEVLPSLMNVVILIAVLSVGNSSIFGSSRTLAALADQGQAPKILSYIDRKGRPIVAIGVASAIGFIAYAADSGAQGTVLDWMLALSGLSSTFTWGSICLAHVRFRRAWKLQGHSLDELAFRSQPGVIGSWIGFAFNALVLVAQFWVGAWPVGYKAMGVRGQLENFFLYYLAVTPKAFASRFQDEYTAEEARIEMSNHIKY
ncbi:hypothetical protein G7Y89_g2538 [Cudoniella acicularis]|uniref:alpha-1,2-Mannosidase n=1 Tax=Cudoniella acicularis TaxID=354080 RepID=A0A8H4RTY5_9HELO|nr:hypothetical protein G7Y89_g2538 [Cudoniella acicularis]